MFREIFDALKRRDRIADLVGELMEMLDLGLWMFTHACDAAQRKVDDGDVAEELYQKDQRINRLERHVREQLVVHLVTGHQQDAGTCLVLMSLIKDAERIGDYCKNIFEIGRAYRGEYRRHDLVGVLNDVQASIDALFPRVKEAFLKGQKKAASAAVEDSRDQRKKCDTILQQLLAPGGETAPDEAVALAMRARYYKRVAAHLGNIATSVNNPVPELDYRGKKPLDEPEPLQ